MKDMVQASLCVLSRENTKLVHISQTIQNRFPDIQLADSELRVRI